MCATVFWSRRIVASTVLVWSRGGGLPSCARSLPNLVAVSMLSGASRPARSRCDALPTFPW
eukprot:5250574-Prorocentrum_lima.AAC.1